jgi:L-ascorbate metabolism protein UlaG (beta-lactamase superfamily)
MGNRYYDGPPSDHFDGSRFFNPGQPSTDRTLADGLRWKLGSRPTPWPRAVAVTPVRPDARVAGLRITVVGHATTLIQAAGLNILTDPVWSKRASPVAFAGPKRIAAPGIAFDDLPPIDAVLLSHCHYDHMNLATLHRLHRLHARDAPLIAMPLGNDAIVRRAIPDAHVVVGDWHERLPLPGGLATTLTRANHWANRGLRDVRMALWAGHWLDTPAGSVWFAGDTGYGDGTIFTDLRDRMGSPDVALIPIGAYEPRWFMSAQHVDPAEAVRIFTDIGAGRALGLHWGVFRLTDEGRDTPRSTLARALAQAGVDPARFVAAEPGHILDHPRPEPQHEQGATP